MFEYSIWLHNSEIVSLKPIRSRIKDPLKGNSVVPVELQWVSCFLPISKTVLQDLFSRLVIDLESQEKQVSRFKTIIRDIVRSGVNRMDKNCRLWRNRQLAPEVNERVHAAVKGCRCLTGEWLY